MGLTSVQAVGNISSKTRLSTLRVGDVQFWGSPDCRMFAIKNFGQHVCLTPEKYSAVSGLRYFPGASLAVFMAWTYGTENLTWFDKSCTQASALHPGAHQSAKKIQLQWFFAKQQFTATQAICVSTLRAGRSTHERSHRCRSQQWWCWRNTLGGQSWKCTVSRLSKTKVRTYARPGTKHLLASESLSAAFVDLVVSLANLRCNKTWTHFCWALSCWC